jgi:hypothetical protein
MAMRILKIKTAGAAATAAAAAEDAEDSGKTEEQRNTRPPG